MKRMVTLTYYGNQKESTPLRSPPKCIAIMWGNQKPDPKGHVDKGAAKAAPLKSVKVLLM